MKDSISSFIDHDTIEAMVKRLAREIETDYYSEELTLIIPLKGSVIFASDLMRALHLPTRVDFVKLSSSNEGRDVRILKDISVDIFEKHVLIIKEIVDAGRTMNFLKERLLANNPASLKVATLLDKPMRRDIPFSPDYIGQIIDDRYLVGYGMDTNELCRNYQNISTLKQ